MARLIITGRKKKVVFRDPITRKVGFRVETGPLRIEHEDPHYLHLHTMDGHLDVIAQDHPEAKVEFHDGDKEPVSGSLKDWLSHAKNPANLPPKRKYAEVAQNRPITDDELKAALAEHSEQLEVATPTAAPTPVPVPA